MYAWNVPTLGRHWGQHRSATSPQPPQRKKKPVWLKVLKNQWWLRLISLLVLQLCPFLKQWFIFGVKSVTLVPAKHAASINTDVDIYVTQVRRSSGCECRPQGITNQWKTTVVASNACNIDNNQQCWPQCLKMQISQSLKINWMPVLVWINLHPLEDGPLGCLLQSQQPGGSTARMNERQ